MMLRSPGVLLALMSLFACGGSKHGQASPSGSAGDAASGRGAPGGASGGTAGSAGSVGAGSGAMSGGAAGNVSGRAGRGAGASGGAGSGSSGMGGGASGSAGRAAGGTGAGAGGAVGAGGAGAGGSAGGSAGTGGSAGAFGAGLSVDGNQLLGPDGKPFHGRGANLADTRSCDACAFAPPDVEGLNRWSDELLDVWHANFVRFTLWSYASSGGRTQWKSVIDDPGYLADIQNTVQHMTAKPGVYVMVTLFLDPSMKANNSDYDSEWPTAQTIPVYQALAGALYDDPKVLFGLTNEPHTSSDHDAELAQRYLDSIDAIRAVEKQHGVPEHVVVVQAPEGWSRYLDYFVKNPLARSNVAYEVHVYNPQSDFDKLLTQPSKTLPIIVGEYGPNQYGTDADIEALWTLCQSLEIPHLAWTFHMRCDPNLLQNTASDGCGLSASTGYNFPRTSWGDMLFAYLAMPW